MSIMPSKISLFNLLRIASYDTLTQYRIIATQGDYVRIPILRKPYLFINHPDGIRDVLVNHFDNYTKEGTTYKRLAAFLGHGILTNSGKAWETRRQETQSYLFGRHLAPWHNTLLAAIEPLYDTLDPYACAGKPVDIVPVLLGVALSVSTQILFGIDTKQYAPSIIQWVHTGNRYATYTSSLSPYWPTLLNAKFQRAKNKLDDLIGDMLKSSQRVSHQYAPLLAPMIEKHPFGTPGFNTLVQEAKNFFVPGHETTGNGLSWLLYCLALAPDAQLRAQQELDCLNTIEQLSFERLKTLNYIEQVIKEGLRLFPPIWIIERRAQKDDSVGGHEVPAGTFVLVCPYTIHRHPDFWTEPDQFIPERFAAKHRDRIKFSYIPFGAGPRVCIGQQLGNLTMTVLLAALLKRYTIELARPKNISVEALITLKARRGIFLKFSRR